MSRKILLLSVVFVLFSFSSCSENIALPNESTSKTIISVATEETLSENDIIKINAKNILEKMTAEEKAGQLFFVRCPADSYEKQFEYIDKYSLGGYILFSEDFKNKTPDELKNNINSYQKASKIPMFIGIDEEGGDIVRVSKFSQYRSEPFESQKTMLSKGYEYLKEQISEKAGFLKEYGININLAPVADVSDNTEDYIYYRTFGVDSEETAKAVKCVVETNNKLNFSSVLKHFPGYGNNEDTHSGIAYDKRSYDDFEKNDFIPFRAGIAAGADAVLVNHNIIECIDPNLPASLSAEVNKVLREKLGFDGVIMTDDLSMKAITDYTNNENPALTSFEAGNDIILQSDFSDGFNAILEAYRSGRISEERINESVLRILEWKIRRGIA